MQEQEQQKQKESDYMDKLKQWCRERKRLFRKASIKEDLNKGIDCYINAQAYDLKGSLSGKLTVMKYFTKGNKWYSPLCKNMDVPYLIPANEEGTVWFIVRKEDVLKYYYDNPTLVSTYSGDGNLNICIDISGMYKQRMV